MRRSENNKLKNNQKKKKKGISNYIRNLNINFVYLNKKPSNK